MSRKLGVHDLTVQAGRGALLSRRGVVSAALGQQLFLDRRSIIFVAEKGVGDAWRSGDEAPCWAATASSAMC
ncbi:hypothetical protein CBOM_07261 [Ceraceosorus bombacis]|uniref:Uncharacterized protein n=1 Tax=Ceraceosorus bombacis TaxID=401625 RepID=A0A0P1B8L5_9BASI|nr:hypothetical protein CBOM_07261 [Ceraceosorus bombacis]